MQALGYNKLCNIEDFQDSQLAMFIRELLDYDSVASSRASFVQRLHKDGGLERRNLPQAILHRKFWEVAMAARTLANLGVLGEDTEILGVGAGDEPTIFWLTRKVKRVFATDLYLEHGAWESTAPTSMLTDPSRHSQGPWNPRRLVVQHMDGLDLQYEDESFGGIFSSSSIEHFGELADVRRAAEEMCRVLRPGGVATLSTEFRLHGGPPGIPGVLLFNAVELYDAIISAGDWAPVDPLDLYSSPASRASPVLYSEAVAGIQRFPHVVLSEAEHLWTSVHLALRKAA